MIRLARLFWLHVVREVLSWSGSWWFIFALAGGQVLPPLIGLAIWKAVFPDSDHISEYYIALIFTVATTASYENHTFSERIYKGTLSEDLVRPQPPILAPLGENTAIRLWIAMFAFPIVLLLAVGTGAEFTAANLLIAFPIWLLTGILRFVFTLCLAMTAFWTERVHAITAFGTTLMYLLGGNAVPVDLLPEGWSALARWSPFYSMVGLPADAAAGISVDVVLNGVVAQVVWLALLCWLGVVLWRRGLMRYTALGG